MYYVDANVILSYIFLTDRNHERAKSFIDCLSGDRIYISTLTLLEIGNSIKRMLKSNRLINQLEYASARIPDEVKHISILWSVIGFLENVIDLGIISDKEFGSKLYGLSNLSVLTGHELYLLELYNRSIEISKHVNLKTLDLLHLTYAVALKEMGLIEFTITFDRDFIKNKDIIRERFGLKVASNCQELHL